MSNERLVVAEETQRLLELRLLDVLEREGATISAPPKARRRVVTGSLKSSNVEARTPLERTDSVLILDQNLLQRTLGQVAIKRNVPISLPLTIRFEEHTPSVYVEELPTVAMLIEEPAVREAVTPWFAPWYRVADAPSLETFVVAANDLTLDEIDPRFFLEQFTPAHGTIAFAERYSLWAKARAPFVRWEVVEREIIIEEQFTPAVATGAISKVYGFGNRVRDFILRGLRAFRTSFHSRRLTPSTHSSSYLPAYSPTSLLAFESPPSVTPVPWQVPTLVPRLDTGRVLIGFVLLLLVVSLPAGAVSLCRSFVASVADVRTMGEEAVRKTQVAVGASLGLSPDAWRAASVQFRAADRALQEANALSLALGQLMPVTRREYRGAQALFEAGDKTTQAAAYLTQGLQKSLTDAVAHPDERLETFLTYLDSAAPLLQEAASAVADVSPADVPVEAQPKVELLKSSLVSAQGALGEMRSLIAFLLGVAGHDRARTYLFIFQNQTELRPTGGFMGSLAEVTFDRGELKRINVPGGGPYDLRSQLLSRVRPPQPLQLVAARWEFQDANWFPDFPAAARKIRRFWSEAGQPTIDGVITINATLLEKMLAVTGPIELPDYGKTITAENVMLELQKSVELEYDKAENKPKKIIGDLLPRVLERVKNSSRNDLLAYAAMLNDATKTKDVQIWMADDDEEAQVENWNWSGRIKPSSGDALALIEANIAGQKTDGVIDERVTHAAEIQSDGSIVDQVTLERSHNGQRGELFRGANNVSYLRVYVPLGSELLSADGFQTPSSTLFKQPLESDGEDPDVLSSVKGTRRGPGDVTITDEFGRTAFGGWIQLAPGATSQTTFRYRLPFTVFDIARRVAEREGRKDSSGASYVLLLTSQSGKANRTITTHVTAPAAWKLEWTNTSSTVGLSPEEPLTWDRDRVIAGYFQLPNEQTTR